MSAALGSLLALRIALEQPTAAPTEPTAPAEPTPTSENSRAWSEALAEPTAPAPTATPPTVAAPATPPPTVQTPPPDITQSPWREAIADTRRNGNALMIGGGVALAVGTALNVTRVLLVTGPCQTESQDGCSAGWYAASFGGWAANLTGIGLAAFGGAVRGRADASDRAERLRRSRPRLIGIGAALVGVGVLANLVVRGMWLDDYKTPGGVVFFDFAQPGDAIAYYGTLQGTSIGIAAGIAMMTYATADPLVAPRVAVTPMLGGRSAGLQVGGRF